ncbi:MAG TPA: hypothetical protein VGF59_06750 [Bryobacteraceae bacterium]
MPFCHQCGNQVGPVDSYCARCGAAQPPAGTPGGARPDPLASINPRTAAILCYIPAVGWIASIIVLAADKFRTNRVVRFHAFQGLYLFVAWLMNDWVLRPLFLLAPNFHVHRIIEAVLLGMSIFMMVKASHNEAYALPLFGELAQRSVAES